MRTTRNKTGYPIWRGLLALSVLFLLACQEEGGGEGGAKNPAKAAAEAKKKEKDKAKDAPPGEPTPAGDAPEWRYNPVGARDPFKSLVEVASEEKVPMTPLQKFDLDQFNLVGILDEGGTMKAMVQDPDGNGHFITIDTLIGKNWGKVVRITPETVVVAEELRDFEGKLIVNELVLALPSLDGPQGKKRR